MKISKIETHVCHARMRNWIFVKVLTDQDGLFGWGEATLEWHTRSVVGAVEDLAQLVVGEDPTRVEHVWQMMFRQHFWHGGGIIRATDNGSSGVLNSSPGSVVWTRPVATAPSRTRPRTSASATSECRTGTSRRRQRG